MKSSLKNSRLRLRLVGLIALGCWSSELLAQESVSLLDGKLKFSLPEQFVLDKTPPAGQEIAKFSATEGGAWGAVTRGTHGLKPEGLARYRDQKVAEFSKGLPGITWLKKDIVKMRGREWADLRFAAIPAGVKDYRDGIVYTRFFSTSYNGQLLEINFTSNLERSREVKEQIDQIIQSVRLDEAASPVAQNTAPPGNPRAIRASEPPEAVLETALRQMNKGLWEVEATITTTKKARVHGMIKGRDFDLAMEPDADGTPIRQIAINDKAWGSYDHGNTWKAVDSEDRLIFSWVHSPVRSGGNLPAFEAVGSESQGNETWLHLRLKVSEKLESEKQRPHYWLALDADGHPLGVRHYEGNLAQGEHVIYCVVDYRPAGKGAAIKPPAASAPRSAERPAPIDETLGFFDIERQKLALAGKIVRVEITGKIISADPLGKEQVRAMVKDTAEHYGLVEFPRAGLEKLGISASYSGKPVALYLLITPQGAKPAAKATAVGSRFTRGRDGKGTYEW